MRQAWSVIILALALLVSGCSQTVEGQEPSHPAYDDGQARAVLKTYLTGLLDGNVPAELLTGVARARWESAPQEQKKAKVNDVWIGEGKVWPSYAVFDVFARRGEVVSTYRYHLVRKDGDWRISLAEYALPAWPEHAASDAGKVSPEAQKAIESFVRGAVEGRDVNKWLAYPLRNLADRKLQGKIREPVTFLSHERLGLEESAVRRELVRSTYRVGSKTVSTLFHVVTWGGVTRICEVVPVSS